MGENWDHGKGDAGHGIALEPKRSGTMQVAFWGSTMGIAWLTAKQTNPTKNHPMTEDQLKSR
jgi:hypothetical protein